MRLSLVNKVLQSDHRTANRAQTSTRTSEGKPFQICRWNSRNVRTCGCVREASSVVRSLLCGRRVRPRAFYTPLPTLTHSQKCAFVLPPQLRVNDRNWDAQSSLVPSRQMRGFGKMQGFDWFPGRRTNPRWKQFIFEP